MGLQCRVSGASSVVITGGPFWGMSGAVVLARSGAVRVIGGVRAPPCSRGQDAAGHPRVRNPGAESGSGSVAPSYSRELTEM